MVAVVHVSVGKFYKFNGWLFEYDRNKPFGPWPCRKDWEPREKAGRRFYKVFAKFDELSIEEQEKYRVY